MINVKEILTEITELDNDYAAKIRELKHYGNKANHAQPSFLRNKYDSNFEKFEKHISNINEEKIKLDDIAITANNSIQHINYLEELYSKLYTILNRGKVGTLEGLSRENLQNGNVPIENMSKLEEEVLIQPYDELKEVSANGGKRKKKKTIKKRRL